MRESIELLDETPDSSQEETLASIQIDGDRIQAGDLSVRLVELEQQDLALLHLDATGFFGSVDFRAPDGALIRSHSLSGERKRPLAFVADSGGIYRIEVKTATHKPVGKLSLTLDRIVSLQERLLPCQTSRLECTRIRRLRSDLNAGKSDAVAAFWREAIRAGTPLFEDDPKDSDLMLCTFLWQGDENTHRIRVDLGSDTALPNNYEMARIEQTDIWFSTIRLRTAGRFKYQLAVNAVDPSAGDDFDHWEMHKASAQMDPFNHHRRANNPSIASKYETYSLIIMPNAPAQPWVDERPNVPRGLMSQVPFASRLLGDARTVSVYTPPGYCTRGEAYSLLVVFDEQWYVADIPTPTILDNLLADGLVPPMVAVIIGNAPGNARNMQLSCNPEFIDFLADELLPWARKKFHITSDPRFTVVAGASLGGLTAAYAALQRPEVFGNVLSQSGSFWAKPTLSNASRYLESNYLAERFIRSPLLPIRFYISPGSEEIDLSGNGQDILLTSRALKNVLMAKGYEVEYSEFIGGHDFLGWQGTLAEGMISLTKFWSIRRHDE